MNTLDKTIFNTNYHLKMREQSEKNIILLPPKGKEIFIPLNEDTPTLLKKELDKIDYPHLTNFQLRTGGIITQCPDYDLDGDIINILYKEDKELQEPLTNLKIIAITEKL